MSNFLESKFRNMAVLLLVFGLAGQENNLAPGQDGNPFQANNKAQDEDPFAANTSAADENPFGKKTASNENPFGRRVVKEDPFASNKGQNSRQVDAKLLQQLTVYKNQIAALEHENDHLKRAVDLYKQLQQSATQSHQHLLMRLLESPEQTLQTIALEALAQHDGKTRLPGEIDERLMELANSGAPGVKELALKWLARYEPAKAVKLGFQLAGPWMPIRTSQRNEQVQRALAEPAFFDLEETQFIEVAEELRDRYGINVIVDPEIDTTTPVTFKSSGLALRDSLKMLLVATELALHVHEEHLEIVPKGLAEPKLSLVYNVKGLLHDDMSLDGIEEQVNGMLTAQDLDGKVMRIDKHRFTITATDTVHDKVAGFLGQLR